MEDPEKKPDPIADIPSEAVVVRGRGKSSKPKQLFERPPFANEIFTEDRRKVFDKLPGRYRHFVKSLVETGNPQMAAKLAGLNSLEKDDTEAKQEDVNKLLAQHGLGPEQLIGYLVDCVKAEVLIRDKHGSVHNTIDIKTRLQTIEFIFKLQGLVDKKPSKPNSPAVDLFANVELEEK